MKEGEEEEKMAAALIVVLYLAISVRHLSSCQNNSKRRVRLSRKFLISAYVWNYRLFREFFKLLLCEKH